MPRFLESNISAPRSRVLVRNPDAFRDLTSNASISSMSDMSNHVHISMILPPQETSILRRKSVTPARRSTCPGTNVSYNLFTYQTSNPNPDLFTSYTASVNASQNMFNLPW